MFVEKVNNCKGGNFNQQQTILQFYNKILISVFKPNLHIQHAVLLENYFITARFNIGVSSVKIAILQKYVKKGAN